METSPTFDFGTQFGAHTSGMTPEAYVNEMKAAIGMLDKVEDAIERMKIKSQEDFNHAYNIKKVLCSLSCYTFNNKLPENDRVWELEGKIAKKMAVWMKSQLAKPDDNLLIRYILWNKRYYGDEERRKKILDRLIEKGYILTRPAGEYNDQEVVVTGIYCKVGDNCFTVGRNGRESRQFVNVCVPQCFELVWDMDKEYLATKDIPMLETEVTMTYMRDGKGCARHPKFTRKDASRLNTLIPF